MLKSVSLAIPKCGWLFNTGRLYGIMYSSKKLVDLYEDLLVNMLFSIYISEKNVNAKNCLTEGNFRKLQLLLESSFQWLHVYFSTVIAMF